jgi:hypothetical protein
MVNTKPLARPVEGHDILPDGYCQTCGVVNCKKAPPRTTKVETSQLTRIEARLNSIARHLGMEIDE